MSNTENNHLSEEAYRRVTTTFPVLAFAAVPFGVLAVVTGEAELPRVLILAGLWIGAMLSVVAVYTYIFRRQSPQGNHHAGMRDETEHTDRVKSPWAMRASLYGGILIGGMIVTIVLSHFGLHVYLAILVGVIFLELTHRKVARRFM